MSGRGVDAAARRSLVRLLRGLAAADALLVRKETSGNWRLQGAAGTGWAVETPLVDLCRRQDLLEQTDEGWRLGANGRLALKRLLAGTDPFQQQHQVRRIERRKIDGEACEVVVNDKATALGWLMQRKDSDGRPMLSPVQFEAGERLARDFTFAGLQPRITSNWARMSSGAARVDTASGRMEMSEQQLAARQRLQRALAEVGGELAGLLLDVCCLQTGLGEAEKQRNWPRRSGKVILQIALDRLAEHYGMKKMPAEGMGDGSGRPIRHWGAPDYRPRIDEV